MATQALPEDAAPETLLDFPDNRLMIELCGQFDANLARVEKGFGVMITRRGNQMSLHGEDGARDRAAAALKALYRRLEEGRALEDGDVDAAIRFGDPDRGRPGQLEMFADGGLSIRTRKKNVEARTAAQRDYIAALFQDDLVFGVGPAGTGKTYLAVAVAVSKFLEGEVDRIVISRPAVEAGEKLGYLPGDMKDKVDPYMQPIYDALHDLLPGKQVARHLEEKRIEVAPLAFMRGRTLKDAYVILDEAQNATAMQMKMFLTRLGQGGRMVVTGDTSQIDLPRGVKSGLIDAVDKLAGVDGVAIQRFTAVDVVRHPLVARIIKAYEAAET